MTRASRITGRHGPLALALAVSMLAAACDALIGMAPGQRSPRPCEDVFAPPRCAAMLTLAAEQLGIPDAEIRSIQIAPDPTPRSDGVLQNRGGGMPVVVLVTTDAGQRSIEMCGGLPWGVACSDQQLAIGSPLQGGYHDVPCSGEPPAGCATPLPTLEPEALAAARPLQIDHRSIPVQGPGLHQIVLGQAAIPNGVLTESRAQLAAPLPEGLTIGSDGIRLEVRSLEPERPAFRNMYEHGWWPGTEEVEVVLVFDARRADPGATIEIVDVVVR